MKQASEDIIKVIVDYHFASLKKRRNTDTGQFVLVTQKKTVEKPLNSFGLSLMCEGKRLKHPSNF